MSQEALFLIFITLELFALVALYNFVIIPMNAKATISRWESKMLEGDFDTVAMLDQYTDHLRQALATDTVEVIAPILQESLKKILCRYDGEGCSGIKKKLIAVFWLR